MERFAEIQGAFVAVKGQNERDDFLAEILIVVDKHFGVQFSGGEKFVECFSPLRIFEAIGNDDDPRPRAFRRRIFIYGIADGTKRIFPHRFFESGKFFIRPGRAKRQLHEQIFPFDIHFAVIVAFHI